MQGQRGLSHTGENCRILTTLKLLSEIQKNFANPTYVVECLDNLYTCQFAQMRYLQEHNILTAGGQFGPTTKTVQSVTEKHDCFYPLVIRNFEDCCQLDSTQYPATFPPATQGRCFSFQGCRQGLWPGK